MKITESELELFTIELVESLNYDYIYCLEWFCQFGLSRLKGCC